MNSNQFVLAIDQGTTSTKSLILDHAGQIVGASDSSSHSIEPLYPQAGWVEYSPKELLDSVSQSVHSAIENAGVGLGELVAMGLANQGETVIAFDRQDGRPIYPAISWQDRRAEEIIAKWRHQGLQEIVFAETGLRLDSYFSAGKLAWILQHVPEAQKLLAKGRLCLGTSDSWILWQLTGGSRFITDLSTASRTLLFHLEKLQWSTKLTNRLGIPKESLPEVVSNTEPIASTSQKIMGISIPITGLCVDQQAALFGHQVMHAGQAKITYGTGCFLQANLGTRSSLRAEGLLTSVGWQIDGQTNFVLEGGVYSAGSLIDWLVQLGLAADIQEIEQLASRTQDTGGVTLIPAFSGLAAPYWLPEARAAWLGMNQATHAGHLVLAALESIAFRIKDIVDVMESAEISMDPFHVDGGLTQCDFLMQLQADILNSNLIRSSMHDVTAWGVGTLAGIGCGMWKSPVNIPAQSGPTDLIKPRTSQVASYAKKYLHWKQACHAFLGMHEEQR